jgi:hypothetical protein
VDIEDEDGIEFISLRRIIDRQIIDVNYMNSIEAENSWKLLVQKWIPSMEEIGWA